MSRTYAVVYTEKIKRVAYFEANSEKEAEKKLINGEEPTESYEEESDLTDIHDVYELEH